MKRKSTLFAALMIALSCTPSLRAAEIQFLRNDKGKLIGTIVQDSSMVTMRDEKGYLLWQKDRKMPEKAVRIQVETKEESCLLKSIIALPVVLTGLLLLVPLAVLKRSSD